MADVIVLKDVSVSRTAGSHVLSGLNLAVSETDRIAVIGPNGAGKTTLLRTIVGLESAASGQVVLFGNHCRTEADFRQARPHIGVLLQDSDDQLFCPTVLDDVCFGPLNCGLSTRQAHDRAHEALQELGISGLAERVTHRLSGGEKRLVCLAGVLAMQPRVLLLDEPTNGVDTHNRARLVEALHRFRGALVLISHDEDFVQALSERQVYLRDGQLT